MKITKRQLLRIIKEEQMTLNQSGVDAVLAMADQIEPMYHTLTKINCKSISCLTKKSRERDMSGSKF